MTWMHRRARRGGEVVCRRSHTMLFLALLLTLSFRIAPNAPKSPWPYEDTVFVLNVHSRAATRKDSRRQMGWQHVSSLGHYFSFRAWMSSCIYKKKTFPLGSSQNAICHGFYCRSHVFPPTIQELYALIMNFNACWFQVTCFLSTTAQCK